MSVYTSNRQKPIVVFTRSGGMRRWGKKLDFSRRTNVRKYRMLRLLPSRCAIVSRRLQEDTEKS